MLLLVAAQLSACVSPLGTTRSSWLIFETPNFSVISDAGEAETRELVRELELFRVTVQEIMKIRVQREPVPVRVYVFGKAKSFRHYRTRSRSVGYFVERPYARYLALSTDNERVRALRVVYHEYVHLLLRHHPTPLATWYDEGVAEIFSTFRVEDGWAQVGLPLEDRLEHLAARHWARSERLFEIEVGSEEYGEVWTGFHAQAWALAHYFMFGEARRREQLEAYLERMNQGVPHADAYALVFDIDEEALWSEVVAHMQAEQFRFGAIPLEELVTPPEPQLRVPEEPEVAYLLGDLMAQLGPKRAADARSLLERSLEAVPDHAEANASMVQVDDFQGRYAEAGAHLERALRSAPDSFRVRMIGGDHYFSEYVRRLADAAKASTPPPPVLDRKLQKARGHYAIAIRLNGRVAEAFERYGRTYLVGSGSMRNGEVALVAARRVWPHDRELAETLALLHLRAGRPVDARQVLASALRSAPESKAVTRWLDELEAKFSKRPAARP
jgi:tetratricopeptide (TPR) repeat protein